MRFTGLAPDIDLDLSVKPVIHELVRTQVCFPNLKLLVDKIVVVTLPDVDELAGNEAYKLTLTDGEKTIQALVKRRIYTTIYSEHVREGSYVILKVYHLARGERVDGEGTIIYIVIEDFYSIGQDDRYDVQLEPIKGKAQAAVELDHTGQPTHRDVPRAVALESAHPVSQDSVTGKEVEDQDENASQTQEKPPPTPPSSQQLREAMKRKWDTALDEIDTNDTYRISKYRRLEEARAKEAREAAAASAKAMLVRYKSLPTTPLVALTGPNKQRNTKHDVLALITSVSEIIKCTGMPPKRDLRLIDISTIKKVCLSVFANAEDFHPEPGTVALFKHLTTHDCDGGSLSAYAKDCQNQEWFVPDPPGFENGEVAQLKDCWARLQFSEQVAREQPDSLSQLNEPLDIPEEEDIADRLPTVSGKKHLTCFFWAKNGSCWYTDDECAYAHYNTGIVAHDPMHNQSTLASNKPHSHGHHSRYTYVATTASNDSGPTERSGLPPSRSLTCFFWARFRKCKRSDEECSYAHYDTGTVAKAPPGVTIFEPAAEEPKPPPTRTLTCYFWNKNGKCSRSDEECAYAHYHTGTVAYPPPTVAASLASSSTADNNATRSDSRPHTAPQPAARPPSTTAPSTSATAAAPPPPPTGKALTCFFWARYGHCNRTPAQCAYAHHDTGVVAHNPNPALYPEPSIVTHHHRLAPASTSPSLPPGGAQLPAATPTSPPSARDPTSPSDRTSAATGGATSTSTAAAAPPPPPPTFPPVKHLTCYFWANFGRCRRSDEECNYAHRHTGRMAVNPAELRRARGRA
ncbi:MAG: hypothetical protein Q9173_006741 [Seirophora scorigena]